MTHGSHERNLDKDFLARVQSKPELSYLMGALAREGFSGAPTEQEMDMELTAVEHNYQVKRKEGLEILIFRDFQFFFGIKRLQESSS